MNKQTEGSKNAFGLLKKGMLLACLMLGFGFAGLQAQDDASFYYTVDGGPETTSGTFEPGDTFTLTVGIDTDLEYQGVTVTMNWDTNLLSTDQTAVTDVSGTVFNFPIDNSIDADLGQFAFTKLWINLTGNLTTPSGNTDFAAVTFTVLETIEVNTVTEIAHVVMGNNMSSISLNGGNYLDGNPPPNFTVNIDAGVEPFDCEELGLNIGDPCDDGDDDTENDTVTDDCECEGTPVVTVDCEELGLNIGDACDDDDDDTENDTVTADCECDGTPIDNTPSNDLCSGAIDLECGETVSGDNTNATVDVQGTCGTSFSSGRGVWYSLSGFSGTISATTCSETGPTFDTKIGIFSGSCDNLTCVGGDDDAASTEATDLDCTIGTATANRASYIEFVASPDSTYYILVAGFGATSAGTFDLTVTCTPFDCEDLDANIGDSCDDGDDSTINDVVTEDCGCAGVPPSPGSVCSDAFTIDCNGEPVTFSSDDSNGTNTTECSIGDNGLWFTFTGTGGDITINSTADFDHEMSINSGSCDDLTNLGCDDGSTQAETFLIENSVDGETYYVYIARFNSGSIVTGDITIDIDCAAPPLCTSPELSLSIQDADGGSIDDCIDFGGEYFVLASLEGGSGNSSYNITINGSDATLIDANGTAVLGPIAVGTDATVTVVGSDDAQCDATALIDSPELCAPSNDNCEDAIAVSCESSTLGTTIGATESSFESPDCAGGTPADVFYTIDAVPGTDYTVTINGDNYDGVLVLYSGTCDGDDLTELDCADNGFTAGVAETLTFSVEEASTIIIRTYDWSSTRGSFTLDVSCETVGFECEADGGAIEFADGSTSVSVCVDDNDPSNVSVAFATAPDAPEGYGATWVVTDADGNLLGLPATAADVAGINFDDAGAGNCLIWFLSFEADNSNVAAAAASFAAGDDVNAADLTGCFELSNSIEVVRENCNVVFDCEELGANIGDPCDDGDADTENDVVTDDCGCEGTPVVVTDCNNFVYYMADVSAESVTSIYSVTIAGGDANLSLLKTLDYEAHIAFNVGEGLLYVVRSVGGSFATLDVSVVDGAMSAETTLDLPLTKVTAAAFNADDKLVLGDDDSNMVRSVNPDGTSSLYTSAAVSGGDLAFSSTSGIAYLALTCERWQALPDQPGNGRPDRDSLCGRYRPCHHGERQPALLCQERGTAHRPQCRRHSQWRGLRPCARRRAVHVF